MDQWIYRKLDVFPDGIKQQPPSPCYTAYKLTLSIATQVILAHGILPCRQPNERRAHRGLKPYSASSPRWQVFAAMHFIGFSFLPFKALTISTFCFCV